mmetsp:Transcript_87622/g.165183  ORF Transcript_87622/g.165183 Transcript_87622/m.165183 type:complete len:618 (+) Transcript_87622:146-1999(+)
MWRGDGRPGAADSLPAPIAEEDLHMGLPKPAPPSWPSNCSGPRGTAGTWPANVRTGRLLLTQSRQPSLECSPTSSVRSSRRPDATPRPKEETRFQSVVAQWVPRAFDSKRLVGLAKPKREAGKAVFPPLSIARTKRSDGSRLEELSRPRKRSETSNGIAAERFRTRHVRPDAAATLGALPQCDAEPSARRRADTTVVSTSTTAPSAETATVSGGATTAPSAETATASGGAANAASSGDAGGSSNSLAEGTAPDEASSAMTREALSSLGHYKCQLSEAEATRLALEAELLQSSRQTQNDEVGHGDEAGRQAISSGLPGLNAASMPEFSGASPAKTPQADSPPPWELATQPLPATRGTAQLSMGNVQAALQEFHSHESPADRGVSTCEWLAEELLALQSGLSAPSSASGARRPLPGARHVPNSTCELLEEEVRALHSLVEKDRASPRLEPLLDSPGRRKGGQEPGERFPHPKSDRLLALPQPCPVASSPGRSSLAAVGSAAVSSRAASPRTPSPNSPSSRRAAEDASAIHAKAALAAEREAKELREVVQGYEQKVLPQLVVQRAVLNCELAAARAGRKALEADHVALCSRFAEAEVEKGELRTQLASARAAAVRRHGGG